MVRTALGGCVIALQQLMRRARLPHSRQPSPIRLRMRREDLPALCRSLGMTRGAEIGVWKGAYSALFCRHGIHMLCVDPWQSYPAWLDTKNSLPVEQAQRLMDSAHAQAVETLSPLQATIVRQFSAEAARDVPDRSLDVVYIDGNHVYDAVVEDLTLWSRKVKRGGLVAGHDYRVFENKPTIHVVRAVQDFTRNHRIAQWFVTAGDKTPSFLWVAN